MNIKAFAAAALACLLGSGLHAQSNPLHHYEMNDSSRILPAENPGDYAIPKDIALAGVSTDTLREWIDEPTDDEYLASMFGLTPGSCFSNSLGSTTMDMNCPFEAFIKRKEGAPVWHTFFCEQGCKALYTIVVFDIRDIPELTVVDTFDVLASADCGQSAIGGTITCEDGSEGGTWSVFCEECDEAF